MFPPLIQHVNIHMRHASVTHTENFAKYKTGFFTGLHHTK